MFCYSNHSKKYLILSKENKNPNFILKLNGVKIN